MTHALSHWQSRRASPRQVAMSRQHPGAAPLVSAFAERELILNAYRHAVAQKYRFYSYGDCMLII